MDETKRSFAACIGEVNNRFLDDEPPVIGATFLLPTPEWDFGVRFLVPTEADVAQADQQDLLARLKESVEDTMTRQGLGYGISRLYVTLSSLEAEGIKR